MRDAPVLKAQVSNESSPGASIRGVSTQRSDRLSASGQVTARASSTSGEGARLSSMRLCPSAWGQGYQLATRANRDHISILDTGGLMGTNVHLTPELEQFAQSCVGSGRFNNISEVVRSGLRLLQ